MKVAYGFVSFTEVEAGEHRSYNEWHLFDHMPEQLPLAGIVWGQRWVLTPELRAHLVAAPPLDRIHYVTLYLLAEPIEQTLTDFRDLAGHLRGVGRFHQHRISHLSGPLAFESAAAAPHALVSPEAVPFRPCRGVHVRVDRGGDDPRSLLDLPGAAGVWTFRGHPDLSPPELRDLRATWCWLDADPAGTAAAGAALPAPSTFGGTLAAVDPQGPWDWFEPTR